MDKPIVKTLHELTGDGAQTILTTAGSSGAVNFYRLDVVADCVLDALEVDGVSFTAAIAAKSIVAPHSFHNVTSVNVASGVCIGYTAPALTGQIEP